MYDLNSDGLVNGQDVDEWLADAATENGHSAAYLTGDANLDGEFNSGDFVDVFTAGKYEDGRMAGWAEGDWDGNMLFDSGDFVAAFTDGGYELGPLPPAPAAVPEPSSIVLSVLAVAFLLARYRLK